MRKPLGILALLAGVVLSAQAADFQVKGPNGKPLALVMVTRAATKPPAVDMSVASLLVVSGGIMPGCSFARWRARSG